MIATEPIKPVAPPYHLHKDGLSIFARDGDRMIQVVDCDIASPTLTKIEKRANARFIVRACNAHEDLVTVLQQVLLWATIEQTPLRQQEIENIRRVINNAIDKVGAQ